MKKQHLLLSLSIMFLALGCQKNDIDPLLEKDIFINSAKSNSKSEKLLNSSIQSFTSEWRIDWPVENGATYKIVISGLYSDGGGANNLDAAFDLRGNIAYNTCNTSIQSRWRFINDCNIRPDLDLVNDLHQYTYTLKANSDVLSFDFKDCCYDDNSGQLTFELYLISSSKKGSGGKPLPISNGLIAYYPFSGNAKDASGNNNNGQAFGTSITNDRFGNSNSAYYFDGVNSMIKLPFTQTNITSYSICAWYKSPTGGTILGGRGVNGETGLSLVLYNSALGGIHNGKFLWEADCSGGGIGQLSKTTYLDNSWHYVVGIFEGEAGSIIPSQFKIYIDGNLFDQEDSYTTTADAPINMANAILGNHNLWSGGGFLGELDEIRIYNRAITFQEVTSLYNLK